MRTSGLSCCTWKVPAIRKCSTVLRRCGPVDRGTRDAPGPSIPGGKALRGAGAQPPRAIRNGGLRNGNLRSDGVGGRQIRRAPRPRPPRPSWIRCSTTIFRAHGSDAGGDQPGCSGDRHQSGQPFLEPGLHSVCVLPELIDDGNDGPRNHPCAQDRTGDGHDQQPVHDQTRSSSSSSGRIRRSSFLATFSSSFARTSLAVAESTATPVLPSVLIIPPALHSCQSQKVS